MRFCGDCGLSMSLYLVNGVHVCPVYMRVQVTDEAKPESPKVRARTPVFEGFIMFFPDAVEAVAEVSVAGNKQYNLGTLRLVEDFSVDPFNKAMRHMMDHKRGQVFDTDKTRHLAKAAWRVMQALQLSIKEEKQHDARRQSQITGGCPPERDGGVLPEARPERHGSASARLPRCTPRPRIRHRNKGKR